MFDQPFSTNAPSLADRQVGGFVMVMLCTPNTALSPLAERLLRHSLAAADVPEVAVTVLSRGTRAPVDEPMKDWTVAFSRSVGADPGHHAAKQITAAELKTAGLIVTLAESQRAWAVKTLPAAQSRIVTLKELNGLIDLPREPKSGVQTLREASAALQQKRGQLVRLRQAPQLSIIEPSWTSSAEQQRCGQEISRATQAVAQWISDVTAPV